MSTKFTWLLALIALVASLATNLVIDLTTDVPTAVRWLLSILVSGAATVAAAHWLQEREPAEGERR